MNDNNTPWSPPMPHDTDPLPIEEEKKPKRVFLWFMLIMNLIVFPFWIFSGTQAEADLSDCGSLTEEACRDAQEIGQGLGVILIVVLWIFFIIIALLGRLVYKVGRKS